MHSLRSGLMIAVLGFAIAGCSSQTTGPGNSGQPSPQKSPDEQFADLKLKYESLTAAEKRGEQGKKLMADLAAVSAQLSDQAKLEASKLLDGHQMLQPFEGPALPDPKSFPFPKDFDPSKLPGFDPGKFPDRKFPDLPKLPPIDPSKIPDLKLPNFDPSKLPNIDPAKLPDLKLPSIDPSKVPELKLPPPRIVPESPKVPTKKED